MFFYLYLLQSYHFYFSIKYCIYRLLKLIIDINFKRFILYILYYIFYRKIHYRRSIIIEHFFIAKSKLIIFSTFIASLIFKICSHFT